MCGCVGAWNGDIACIEPLQRATCGETDCQCRQQRNVCVSVCSAPVTVYFCWVYVPCLKLNLVVDFQCTTLPGGLKWCRVRASEGSSSYPTTEGSSEAATWCLFAAGLWLRPGRQRQHRVAGHCLGSGIPRPRLLYCGKAPVGVGHALFVLSDDQLTRVFHSAKTALCCAFANCVLYWCAFGSEAAVSRIRSISCTKLCMYTVYTCVCVCVCAGRSSAVEQCPCFCSNCA